VVAVIEGLAFLVAVTDDAKLGRLTRSIDELERPDGFEIAMIERRDATSLPTAYNELQREAADWRYKAYVHQDAVVRNRALIPGVLRIFRRKTVGLIGPAGCRYLPESGLWWDGSGVFGRVVHLTSKGEETLELEQPEGQFEVVEAVDGLCMITQHDVPWDEAIGGFHFYDVAQSLRYVLAGYDVVVPRQEEPWFAHDETPRSVPQSAEYLGARDAFRERYWADRERFQRSRIRRRVRRAATRVRTLWL
jgi:hypothetical protein